MKKLKAEFLISVDTENEKYEGENKVSVRMVVDYENEIYEIIPPSMKIQTKCKLPQWVSKAIELAHEKAMHELYGMEDKREDKREDKMEIKKDGLRLSKDWNTISLEELKKDIISKRCHYNRIALRECAKQIGISASTLSRVERGRIPDLITYAKLCMWLDKNMNYYFEYKDKKTYIDTNGNKLSEGDTIDLHQTVNGQNLFVVLSINPLDIRYSNDINREYEYDKEEMLAPSKLTGETEWEIVKCN